MPTSTLPQVLPRPQAHTPKLTRILAGPGTGKTRELIRWLYTLLQGGAAPATLLAVTFSNRAATEMAQRLAKAVTPVPWMGTFHALAYRILADLRLLPTPVEAHLDQLIPLATAALRRPGLPAWIGGVRYVAVDEAQDLDGTQVEFLNALFRHMQAPELLLVGDPDQAIYGFRRASAEHLLRAEATFQGPCKTVVLADNYRSAKQIVAFARELLSPTADPLAPCRTLTAMRPEDHPAIRSIVATSPEEEAARIFEEIRMLRALEVPAQEIAILCRLRHQMPVLEAEAVRHGLPVFRPSLRAQIEYGQETPMPPAGSVQLMTMHQSKCTEFRVVFLAGVQQHLIPYRRAVAERGGLDEERRLLYVAVTRPKMLLWICRHGALSPFLAPSPAAPAPRRPAPSPAPEPQGWLHWLSRYFSARG